MMKKTLVLLVGLLAGSVSVGLGQSQAYKDALKRIESSLRRYQARPPAGDTTYIAQAIGPHFRIVRCESFKPFSLGGTDDLVQSEVQRMRDFFAQVKPGNRVYGEGATDIVPFEPKVRVRAKRDHAQQAITGLGRKIMASEIALEYGLYLHPLNERTGQPFGNRQITLVEAEPVPQQTTVVNNYYTVEAPKNEPNFFSDLKVGVGLGIVWHTGHIRAVLPAISGFLSKGDWTLSFSYGYWQKQSQDRSWESSSIELAFTPVHVGDFHLGFALGGQTTNENLLLSGFHMKQERGVFVGLRPGFLAGGPFSIEGSVNYGLYNLSQYKAQANETVGSVSFALSIMYEL